jgi:hypothetical protein
MTEKEVQLLGFNKELINEYDGDETYYYVFDIVNGLSFITDSSEKIQNENWSVEVFNTEPSIKFDNFSEVQSIINKFTKAIVKNG